MTLNTTDDVKCTRYVSLVSQAPKWQSLSLNDQRVSRIHVILRQVHQVTPE